MGTPEFGAVHLDALARSFDVVGVVTQPDRPSGRGRTLTAPPVKTLAEQLGIPTIQPESAKDEGLVRQLAEWRADVGAVVAYGGILPAAVIDVPRLGWVNLHPSLLPRWRGGAPVPWAIMAGDCVTGVSTQQVRPRLDTGDVLLQREVTILPTDTTETLFCRLAPVGAELLVDTLRGLDEGTLRAKPQDPALVTYAPKLTKADGRIDWERDAAWIARQIRACRPWPGTYTHMSLGGKTVGLRVLAAEALCEAKAPPGSRPGQVIGPGNKGMLVATGDGLLAVSEIQREGKKAMPADAFMAGHADLVGKTLGE